MSTVLKEAALHIFSQYGYEGTSLSQIADQVGLKKQSIYAHFKGKDDLFLQVVRDSYCIELDRITALISDIAELPLQESLFKMLRSYIDSFQNSSHLRFYLRVSFYPPPHLYDEINGYSNDHVDRISELWLQLFKRAAENGELAGLDPEVANMAYSSLVDSICLELVYGGSERTERRLKAAWYVYWKGISN
ncbi:TetR/AcrR family transcriptional regulator [Paenibacillus sp. GSMTC-2017]|uniref:TetR/AcrR family transcriptional regulator n=1 Tax=Paenibacillus sp. GSMTC-2017 TaxID=2794350 RepID=UPI0018D84CFF|nr:TetR/AcrR family transcriptional regulator [Paenibacillus sp. GSMTC-2017]MBH5318904.1 TetR/AcrR family transcriptional regulator [Paenibacillus sp. GSMTC-2017]